MLINNLEATYFEFDEEKIFHIAKQASELGIDMMVLDDGWFGKRDDVCYSGRALMSGGILLPKTMGDGISIELCLEKVEE